MSFVFQAEVRSDLGKGASRRLRHADLVPAIVYGAGKEAVSVTLDHKADPGPREAGFYSSELTLVINGEEVKVNVKAIQRHPVRYKAGSPGFRSASNRQRTFWKRPPNRVALVLQQYPGFHLFCCLSWQVAICWVQCTDRARALSRSQYEAPSRRLPAGRNRWRCLVEEPIPLRNDRDTLAVQFTILLEPQSRL